MKPKVILHDALKKQWLSFEQPVSILQAHKTDDILNKLEEIQTRVEQENLYATGFLSYEASPAFDSVTPAIPR